MPSPTTEKRYKVKDIFANNGVMSLPEAMESILKEKKLRKGYDENYGGNWIELCTSPIEGVASHFKHYEAVIAKKKKRKKIDEAEKQAMLDRCKAIAEQEMECAGVLSKLVMFDFLSEQKQFMKFEDKDDFLAVFLTMAAVSLAHSVSFVYKEDSVKRDKNSRGLPPSLWVMLAGDPGTGKSINMKYIERQIKQSTNARLENNLDPAFDFPAELPLNAGKESKASSSAAYQEDASSKELPKDEVPSIVYAPNTATLQLVKWSNQKGMKVVLMNDEGMVNVLRMKGSHTEKIESFQELVKLFGSEGKIEGAYPQLSLFLGVQTNLYDDFVFKGADGKFLASGLVSRMIVIKLFGKGGNTNKKLSGFKPEDFGETCTVVKLQTRENDCQYLGEKEKSEVFDPTCYNSDDNMPKISSNHSSPVFCSETEDNSDGLPLEESAVITTMDGLIEKLNDELLCVQGNIRSKQFKPCTHMGISLGKLLFTVSVINDYYKNNGFLNKHDVPFSKDARESMEKYGNETSDMLGSLEKMKALCSSNCDPDFINRLIYLEQVCRRAPEQVARIALNMRVMTLACVLLVQLSLLDSGVYQQYVFDKNEDISEEFVQGLHVMIARNFKEGTLMHFKVTAKEAKNAQDLYYFVFNSTCFLLFNRSFKDFAADLEKHCEAKSSIINDISDRNLAALLGYIIFGTVNLATNKPNTSTRGRTLPSKSASQIVASQGTDRDYQTDGGKLSFKALQKVTEYLAMQTNLPFQFETKEGQNGGSVQRVLPPGDSKSHYGEQQQQFATKLWKAFDGLVLKSSLKDAKWVYYRYLDTIMTDEESMNHQGGLLVCWNAVEVDETPQSPSISESGSESSSQSSSGSESYSESEAKEPEKSKENKKKETGAVVQAAEEEEEEEEEEEYNIWDHADDNASGLAAFITQAQAPPKKGKATNHSVKQSRENGVSIKYKSPPKVLRRANKRLQEGVMRGQKKSKNTRFSHMKVVRTNRNK